MAPPRKSIAPSTLEQLMALDLSNIPYEDIGKTLLASGWYTALRETAVQPSPVGTTLITFDLMVGTALATLERFDQITVSLAAGPGPISVAARLAARESVIFMLTGRLPPNQPKPATVQEQVAPRQTNGRAEPEQTVDMSASDDDVLLPGEQTYVDDTPPTQVNVIASREPDGLPIFRDLYDIGEPEVKNTGEIIEAVLEEVQVFLDEAKSTEQILALATKNPDMLEFIKDVGTEAQLKAVLGMVEKRRNELNRPVGAVPPRRRQPSVPRAN
jgi:hypothetical protein